MLDTDLNPDGILLYSVQVVLLDDIHKISELCTLGCVWPHYESEFVVGVLQTQSDCICPSESGNFRCSSGFFCSTTLSELARIEEREKEKREIERIQGLCSIRRREDAASKSRTNIARFALNLPPGSSF